MKKSLQRRIAKIALVIFIVLAGLLGIVLLALTFQKDQIAERILLSANNQINGEIDFSDLTFNPFVHFPNVSIQLHDVLILADTNDPHPGKEDTVLMVSDMYAALNISKLMSGDMLFSKISMVDGKLNIVKFTDSTLNLASIYENKDTITDIETDSLLTTVVLEAVTLKNIRIDFKDYTLKDQSNFTINKLDASYSLHADSVKLDLRTDIDIHKLVIDNNISTYNKHVLLNTSLYYDEQQYQLTIYPSRLELERAIFELYGGVEFNGEGNIDLAIIGSDEDFSFFQLFLSDFGLMNLKSGDVFFNGNINGPFINTDPTYTFDFGMENVYISIPDSKGEIKDLEFEGHFSSGSADDYSDAVFRLTELSAELPEGFLKGNVQVINFEEPEIDYMIDMEADITGFDKVFDVLGLEAVSGKVKFRDELKGKMNKDGYVANEIGNLFIEFDEVRLNVPGAMEVQRLDGVIDRNRDSLFIHDLYYVDQTSNLFINGSTSTFSELLFGIDKDIVADLVIRSDTFDLPDFLSFVPEVKESFDYRILNVDLDVHVETSVDKLLHFEANPEMDFLINDLKGTVEGLFPPAHINSGHMLMTEKEERIHLLFNDFDLDVERTNLIADVEYFSPENTSDVLDIDVEITSDSANSVLFGEVNGDVSIAMKLGMDSLDFEHISLQSSKLNFFLDGDSIYTRDLVLEADSINIERYSGQLTNQASYLQIGNLKVKDVGSTIIADNGEFRFIPNKSQLFQSSVDGFYLFRPFDDVPTYHANYSIESFQLETFLINFMEDTVMTGPMNLKMDVLLEIRDTAYPLNGLNGDFYLYGKDMMFYGIDIDDFIQKYKRSQRFTLLDVGAVAVLGPFGLAVSKGSDYAGIVITDHGDKTEVGEFISDWTIQNGRLHLKDVAFTTQKNRVVGKGWIDLVSDSLELEIAVVDVNGCSILSQTLSGTLSEPKQGELKIVGKILAPITNLIEGALGTDCEVFYDGSLEHPLKKKKK